MTIRAVVFDAYGTLFDVNAAAREAAAHHALLADVWPDLSQDWRRKQLEYTWLRSLMEDHADFWKITADALDWALEAHGLNDLGLRTRLLDLYRELPAYPEAAAMLAQLKGMGVKRAILSNGTPSMLNSAMTAAGLQAPSTRSFRSKRSGSTNPPPRLRSGDGAFCRGTGGRAVCFFERMGHRGGGVFRVSDAVGEPRGPSGGPSAPPPPPCRPRSFAFDGPSSMTPSSSPPRMAPGWPIVTRARAFRCCALQA
ncbi:HAD-IA family hydrolase [Gemmobacter lanyuensis]